MSIDKQSAGSYNGSPNKTQNREFSSPSQEGYIKTKGGQREGYEHREIVHLHFYTVCLEDYVTVLFSKIFCPWFFFSKYPFIPQSAVFPLAMCSGT